MQQQFAHAMLPKANHDERARQAFVQSLKVHLATKVVQGNRETYEQRVRPALERENGQAPTDRRAIAAAMTDEPFYRLWGSLQRCSQEMCWNAVLDSIERQTDDLATRPAMTEGTLGSLELDPDLAMPRYLSALDIHCMPGGYGGQAFDGDVTAGALYDRGGYIYAMGGWEPDNGVMGRTVAGFIKQRFGDLAPARILDLGCGVGHGTLPYVDAFPDAELHAIDVAQPMLRYAFGRANAMGKAVHFRQANAEATPYPDGHFDLVVSHILLHETSAKAIRRIMAECFRLLRPGGLMVHVDLSLYSGMDPFDAFMLDWDTRHNNEPFWSVFRMLDPTDLITAAGFAAEDVTSGHISRTAVADHVFSDNRDSGGRKNWEILGARKQATPTA